MKIGFVGPGKVGCSLGAYLKANHQSVCGYFGGHIGSAKEASLLTKTRVYDTSKALAEACDILFLTVPDGQIAPVWESIRNDIPKGKIVCHCSGALSSAVFSDAEKYGIAVYSVHPLLAIPDKSSGELLKNAFFTIEGSASCMDEVCALFKACNNPIATIAMEQKIRYHAAAVFASNLAIGLMEQAAALLENAGFSEEMSQEAFKSLAIGNLQNYFNVGAKHALTGPVERNDIDTVAKHLTNLNDEAAIIYKTLSKTILQIARQKHPDWDFSQMVRMLEGEIS